MSTSVPFPFYMRTVYFDTINHIYSKGSQPSDLHLHYDSNKGIEIVFRAGLLDENAAVSVFHLGTIPQNLNVRYLAILDRKRHTAHRYLVAMCGKLGMGRSDVESDRSI